jgi:hypothetical protein
MGARMNTGLPFATETSSQFCDIPNHCYDELESVSTCHLVKGLREPYKWTSTERDQTQCLSTSERARKTQSNNTANDIDPVECELGDHPGLRLRDLGGCPLLLSRLLRVRRVRGPITARVLLKARLLLLLLGVRLRSMLRSGRNSGRSCWRRIRLGRRFRCHCAKYDGFKI